MSMAAAVAAAWLLIAPSWPNGPVVPGVPALLVLVLVVAAELCTVDVFLHKETHSISLRAIPLVAGLFVLAPSALLVVVLLGVGGVLVVKARQAVIKLLFNVALIAVEVTVALTVFHGLLGPRGIDDPRAWVAAMAAALAVDLVCALLVTLAIRVHDPEVPASPGAWLTIAGRDRRSHERDRRARGRHPLRRDTGCTTAARRYRRRAVRRVPRVRLAPSTPLGARGAQRVHRRAQPQPDGPRRRGGGAA